ncbi:MAG TPA: hypothetical protein VN260_01835 [Dissulfurispiraceae bacterium]|nr:hypothetical protein [Dissulfurispiraceae bacterium]
MAKTLKFTGTGDAYTVFERDQVLTADQLNDLSVYLDSQDRLTRLCLSGAGIVCGLDVRLLQGSLTVSKGCAVTTDGDLLVLPADRTFTKFRAFEDKEAHYTGFISADKQIPLYELLEDSAQAKPLSAFNSINEYVCILYLESYDFDPDICTGGACDNKGKVKKENLRVLLAEADKSGRLLGDMVNPRALYARLPDLSCQRPLLSTKTINSYDSLAGCYKDVIDGCLKRVTEVLPLSYSACETLLNGVYADDPTKVWMEKLEKIRTGLGSHPLPGGIQYIWDFLRDLSEAYGEFRESLFQDGETCLPDRGAFPKHLLLGPVGLHLLTMRRELRHGFYPSPALAGCCAGVEKARFLHRRIDCMIRTFAVPAGDGSIVITPDREAGSTLGTGAIPFYYTISKEIPLNRFWSYELYRRGRTDEPYSYHAVSYSNDDRVLNPLKYDLSSYPCLRIEGHVGKDHDAARIEILKLLSEHDLPVRIQSFQIEDHLHLLPWKPPKFFGSLKAFHNLLRVDLHSRIVDLSDYAGKLNKAIQESPDIPSKEVSATTLSIKEFSQQKTEALEIKLGTIRGELRKSGDAMDHANFEKVCGEAVVTAAELNKSVRGVTYHSAFSPYESLIDSTQYLWLKRIQDLLRHAGETFKVLSLFGRFLLKNPGIGHSGAVRHGGTLILVYSSATKRVVADFSLPYWCPDMEEGEEDADYWPELEVKPNWSGLNDLLARVSKETQLAKIIDEVKADLGKVSAKVTTHEAQLVMQKNALEYQTGTIDSIINTIHPPKTNGKFVDPDLSRTADILKGIEDYAKELDDRVKNNKATEQDLAMRKELDMMSVRVIANSLTRLGKREADITVGSEEERFIDFARAKTSGIRDVEARKGLASSVDAIRTEAAGKTGLAGKLSGFMR